MNNEEKILLLLESLNGKVESLNERVGNLENEIKFLRETVVKIEVDHGRKLGALFDGYMMLKEKIEGQGTFAGRIETLETKMMAVNLKLASK